MRDMKRRKEGGGGGWGEKEREVEQGKETYVVLLGEDLQHQ